MTKEQEMMARSSFTGIDINELMSDKCLIRLTQQQYQDAIQLVLHLDKKIRVLTDDNEQLMSQIAATGNTIEQRRNKMSFKVTPADITGLVKSIHEAMALLESLYTQQAKTIDTLVSDNEQLIEQISLKGSIR